jgi:hypothetical protein
MKIKKSLFAAILAMSANALQAVEITAPSVTIQGGSKANAVWRAPLNRNYKVWVFVPGSATAVNALYRVYPKGKDPYSTTCVTLDAYYPCIETSVNQALNKNKWVQLIVNNYSNTTWDFIGGRGYVTVASNKLSATENLGVAGVRFEEVSPYFFYWSRALASISALKLAIGECLNDTSGNYALCDSTSTSELGKYGLGTLPVVENAVVTLVANTAAIQIAGNAALAGCTFQFQATVDSAAGTIRWQPKATAAVAPSSSVAECAQYVKNATY